MLRQLKPEDLSYEAFILQAEERARRASPAALFMSRQACVYARRGQYKATSDGLDLGSSEDWISLIESVQNHASRGQIEVTLTVTDLWKSTSSLTAQGAAQQGDPPPSIAPPFEGSGSPTNLLTTEGMNLTRFIEDMRQKYTCKVLFCKSQGKGVGCLPFDDRTHVPLTSELAGLWYDHAVIKRETLDPLSLPTALLPAVNHAANELKGISLKVVKRSGRTSALTT
ncbi:Hypothetical protein D9617_52g060360 [Elsinoe fawcettii]|nr:Hypothetical protein D9617_52g060360 [Elsinoe fawcettii]